VNKANSGDLVDGLPLALADGIHFLMMWCRKTEMNIFVTTPCRKCVGSKVGTSVSADVVKFLHTALTASAGEEMLDGFNNGGCVGLGETNKSGKSSVGVDDE